LSATSVKLDWTASTDAGGLAGYDVVRGSTVVATNVTTTTYTDSTAAASTTYSYIVRARDVAGNATDSAAASATTPAGSAPPLFQNGFETGNLSGWTTQGGLTVQSATVHSGGFAAEGNTTAGATYAKKTLAAAVPEGFERVYFNVKSSASQVNLVRMRSAGGVSIGYAYLTASGQLGWRNDIAATTTLSSVIVPPGSGWHSLEVHLRINGASGLSEIFLDGTRVAAISFATTNLGSNNITEFQIGEVQSGRTYDVVFDDVVFATSSIGP
jgi:hypothetical protein